MPDDLSKTPNVPQKDREDVEGPSSEPKDKLDALLNELALKKMLKDFEKSLSTEDSFDFKPSGSSTLGGVERSPEETLELQIKGVIPFPQLERAQIQDEIQELEPGTEKIMFKLTFDDLNQPEPRLTLADLGYDYMF